jgi:hypothetical protein
MKQMDSCTDARVTLNYSFFGGSVHNNMCLFLTKHRFLLPSFVDRDSFERRDDMEASRCYRDVVIGS